MVRKAKEPKVAQPLKLDLGCGLRKQNGFIGVDSSKIEGVDVVHDLNKFPWPWASGSVNEVYSSHFLEHLNGQQRIKFMEELYRILEDGGKATIIVPYYASMRAAQDPTHQWPPICDTSMLYFNRGWREANKLDHYLTKKEVDFDYNMFYHLTPEWASRSEEARTFAVKHYINVVSDIQFNLVKRPCSTN